MKGYRIFICYCIVVFNLPSYSEKTVEEIYQCFQKTGLSQVTGFRIQQTTYKENGEPQTYRAECCVGNKGEKMIIKFEEPLNMEGVKVLFKEYGDQLWIYSPATNRVRKIALAKSTEKVGTLGFSYADIFPYLQSTNHNSKIIESQRSNEKNVTILEMTHEIDENNAISVAKTQIYVDDEQGIVRKSIHLTQNNRVIKTIYFKEYQTLQGKTIPGRIEIEQLDVGEKNVIEVLAIDTETKYDPTFFSEISLKR